MKCPTCPDSMLVMTERSGVEIDYCPTCRGVWLDRGELDKIIERAAVPATTAAAGRADSYDDRRSDDRRQAPRYDDRRSDDRYDKDAYGKDGYGKKRKRESLLSELFDF